MIYKIFTYTYCRNIPNIELGDADILLSVDLLWKIIHEFVSIFTIFFISHELTTSHESLVFNYPNQLIVIQIKFNSNWDSLSIFWLFSLDK